MLIAVTVLTGCGSDGSRTVPVLWAATQSDGTIAGGIEPAKVEVRSIGEPGFTLSLEDIAAEGAGDQWQAASSSAAAVGTLLSGADPNDVDVDFEVTGPIDGPSGGAALTVGVLAAIRGDDLRPGHAVSVTAITRVLGQGLTQTPSKACATLPESGIETFRKRAIIHC